MPKGLTERRESIAILSMTVLFAFFAIVIGATWFNNVPSLLRDVSWLGIVAVGQAMVIISGEFDLSVGSVYAFVSMIFLMLLNAHVAPLPAFVLAMLLGLLIGLVNGLLTWHLKLPSLLVTLGFLFVYRGLVEYVTGGFALIIPDEIRGDALLQMLGGKTLGLHNSIALFAVILGVAVFVMAKTRFGSHVYAVGGDVNAATATGVPVGSVKVRAFMVSAALAGFAGIVTAISLSSVSTTTATAMEFEAIAAVVIGGCALLGGAGTVWGALFGVVTLLALKHGLIMLGINIFTYQIVLGLALVGLVSVRGIFPRMLSFRGAPR